MNIVLLGNFPPLKWFVRTYVARFMSGTDIEVSAVVARIWRWQEAIAFFKRYRRRQKRSPSFYQSDSEGKPPRQVFFTRNFNSPKLIARLKAIKPDLLVFLGGMDILRDILDVPRIGTLGAHYGKLPDIRGLHTLEWSILLGKEASVSVQFMERGIDTGDIVMVKPIQIEPGDTIQSLRDKASFLSRKMLLDAILAVQSGKYVRRKQALNDGKQFFRMHPYLLQTVEHKLTLHSERDI